MGEGEVVQEEEEEEEEVVEDSYQGQGQNLAQDQDHCQVMVQMR